MFTAALLITAKRWEQPEWLFTDFTADHLMLEDLRSNFKTKPFFQMQTESHNSRARKDLIYYLVSKRLF
jgi:hypothetical protein